MSYIYGIIDKNTEKYIYIGQTTRDNPEIRKKEHFKNISNKKHKIKQLNTYKPEDLDFEALCEVETDNSLVLATLENFYNSLLHPYNRCVINGYKSSVTLKREENKELCMDIIRTIQKYY